MNNVAPTKAEIALLEPFVGLTLERIRVPTSLEEFASAAAEIKAAGIVGFDTESKPTFVTGDVSEGPHVVQFALHDRAYLFQVHRTEGHPFLIELLQSEQVIKVGFDLKSDGGHIHAKLGVELDGVVDLNTVFHMVGHHKHMGVRAAVGLVFNQRFSKPRHVTTSNWSQHQLTPKQMLYAANDAYAALKVLEALALPREALPIYKFEPGIVGQTEQPANSDSLAFRSAKAADIDTIVALVNSAYRGDSSRAGWTTEADILGGQRTDVEEISRLVAKNDSVMLLCLRDDELIGSVYLERMEAATAYMGMLVIKPVLQGQGLGHRFMTEAERFASTEWGASRMRMQVISLRKELIAYYERRGYRHTGATVPFPASDPKFGLPKVEGLMFEVFEKRLD